LDNTPALIFWILSLVCVVATIFCVTAKRAIHVLIGLVISILSLFNLFVTLGLVGLAVVYVFLSLVVLATLLFALKKAIGIGYLSHNLISKKKQVPFFLISILIFIGCLFLISNTEVWRYQLETANLSFMNLLTSLSENYLLPFLLFKATLLLILATVIIHIRRKVG
jgi:NADH:ubiquinone oxidoreductase subunit 6 (subunit J)